MSAVVICIIMQMDNRDTGLLHTGGLAVGNA